MSRPSGKKVFDATELEAQFTRTALGKIGSNSTFGQDDEDVIEFDDRLTLSPRPISKATMTLDELEAQFQPTAMTHKRPEPVNFVEALSRNSSETTPTVKSSPGPKPTVPPSAAISTAGAGPPPGLPPGLTAKNVGNLNAEVTMSSSLVNSLRSSTLTPATMATASNMSSTCPLSGNDANRGFMNRFEKDLIARIHRTQLTTDTPLMDDFYYQALRKKRSEPGESSRSSKGGLLYFPLPSTAERERELQRRERRRAAKARESGVSTTATGPGAVSTVSESTAISADLVLGKVSHSSSRKPRQQLQLPAFESVASSAKVSLHDQVMAGIEAVYSSILAVEDVFLEREEPSGQTDSSASEEKLRELKSAAQDTIVRELRLCKTAKASQDSAIPAHHHFIHFLTIPKGRAIIPRALKLLTMEYRAIFLHQLVEYFDFLEVIRPETAILTVDAFISMILSPLVEFVGEAETETVVDALRGLFGKRSFVWIALTKAGMVLLCILLSRIEILKAELSSQQPDQSEMPAALEEASGLIEKMFDALEGHFAEFFLINNAHDNRDFYAWQCLALLALNIDSDRKRTLVLELRDKILSTVETGDAQGVQNLNVFLNALGLDASQLM